MRYIKGNSKEENERQIKKCLEIVGDKMKNGEVKIRKPIDINKNL